MVLIYKINKPKLYVIKETSQAIEHCNNTTNIAYAVPSSFFTVATAATHGVYNNENTKNTNAVSLVNNIGNWLTSPISTVKVLTTLSFAINPVINAVDILQSLIPNGLNIGTINSPKWANKLFDESVTKFNLESKCSRNQIIIVATKIIVNALVIKLFDLL